MRLSTNARSKLGPDQPQATLAGISGPSDKKGGHHEGLLRVRQGDGLFGFSVKPEESEKVLSCQFVDHEYLTGGALRRLRKLSMTACASPQGEAKRQRRYSREHWVIRIWPTNDAV
jgi:hypothetical protein